MVLTLGTDFIENDLIFYNSLHVQRFLKKYQLEKYSENFLSNGYDELKDLLDMTEEDLIEIGMTKKKDYTRFLSAVDDLKKEEASNGQANDMTEIVRNFSLLWTILFSRFDRPLTYIFCFLISST